MNNTDTNEMKPTGVLLFFREWRPLLRRLRPEDFKTLFTMVMDYAEFGVVPDEDEDLVAAMFDMLRPRLDFDRERYLKVCAANREKAKKRWEKKENPAPEETAPDASDAGEFRGMPQDANMDSNNDIPLNNEPYDDSLPEGKEKVKKRKPDPLPEDVRKPRGEYGRVMLSDRQEEQLLQDLGPAEYSRCLRYVDEFAQSNGNKNKWKDWNLVIRRCSREGWGGERANGSKSSVIDRQKSNNIFLNILEEGL